MYNRPTQWWTLRETLVDNYKWLVLISTYLGSLPFRVVTLDTLLKPQRVYSGGYHQRYQYRVFISLFESRETQGVSDNSGLSQRRQCLFISYRPKHPSWYCKLRNFYWFTHFVTTTYRKVLCTSHLRFDKGRFPKTGVGLFGVLRLGTIDKGLRKSIKRTKECYEFTMFWVHYKKFVNFS